MASIDRATVMHVARLSRLELTEQELQTFETQLSRILDYISALQKAETAGVEPLSHPLGLKSVFRDDIVKPSMPREDALKNAPARTEEAYKVPVVVDQS